VRRESDMLDSAVDLREGRANTIDVGFDEQRVIVERAQFLYLRCLGNFRARVSDGFAELLGNSRRLYDNFMRIAVERLAS